jgi:hypothetical protein
MEDQLRSAWPEITVDETASNPLDGALWRARRGL